MSRRSCLKKRWRRRAEPRLCETACCARVVCRAAESSRRGSRNTANECPRAARAEAAARGTRDGTSSDTRCIAPALHRSHTRGTCRRSATAARSPLQTSPLLSARRTSPEWSATCTPARDSESNASCDPTPTPTPNPQCLRW